jgi:hypothetical protein
MTTELQALLNVMITSKQLIEKLIENAMPHVDNQQKEKKCRDSSGVYLLICQSNGKAYCGKGNFYNREANHYCYLRKGSHKIKALQEDFNKYGEDDFLFLPVYFAGEESDTSALVEKVLTNVLRLRDPKNGYNRNNQMEGFTDCKVNFKIITVKS